MTMVPDLPAWAEVAVAILVVAGAIISLLGSVGIARLWTVYDRTHASTIGSSGGVFFLSLASIVTFTIVSDGLQLKPILIFLFFNLTGPISLLLLMRASLYRDRAEGNPDVPLPRSGVSKAASQEGRADKHPRRPGPPA